MKISKFFKVAVASALLITTMAVPVMASKKSYEFDLSMEYGNEAHSAINYKDDNEQRAYVHTQDGNISSVDVFTMQIVGPNSDIEYCETQRITSNSETYPFDYVTYVGQGGGARIRAITNKFDVWVTGYWYS